MTEWIHDAPRVALIGIGATAAMDLWLLLLKRLKVPTLDFALLGRWTGHVLHGRWAHEAIARAAPVRRERALGWLAHYTVGIAFAALCIGLYGTTWAHAPTFLPALAFGVGTVALPLFVMQPAMGAGIASSRTATPIRNCLRSIATHAVFGAGLYLSARAAAWT